MTWLQWVIVGLFARTPVHTGVTHKNQDLARRLDMNSGTNSRVLSQLQGAKEIRIWKNSKKQ
jgi:DNA-binding MarR family transcriptional regulator